MSTYNYLGQPIGIEHVEGQLFNGQLAGNIALSQSLGVRQLSGQFSNGQQAGIANSACAPGFEHVAGQHSHNALNESGPSNYATG